MNLRFEDFSLTAYVLNISEFLTEAKHQKLRLDLILLILVVMTRQIKVESTVAR